MQPPYAADRTSGWRNETRNPISTSPASTASDASSGLDVERARCSPHDHGIAHGLGRGDGEEPLRREWEVRDPPSEALLDLTGDRQHRRHAEPTGQLAGVEPLRPFDERERVAVRLGHDAVAHPFVEGDVEDGAEQRLRVTFTETSHEHLRELGEARGVVADREHEGDVVRQQPPGDERERVRGGAIEPLRVVDDAQHGSLLGRVRQQVQDREPDEQSIGWSARRRPEGGAHRVALRFGERVEAIEQRCDQLVERRERELHLGLDARGAEHVEARRRALEVAEQRALADPRITADHEHPTLPVADSVEQVLELVALLRPPDQVRGRRGRPVMGATVDRGTVTPCRGARQGNGPEIGTRVRLTTERVFV